MKGEFSVEFLKTENPRRGKKKGKDKKKGGTGRDNE